MLPQITAVYIAAWFQCCFGANTFDRRITGVIGVMTVFTTFFFGACEYGDRHCRYSE